MISQSANISYPGHLTPCRVSPALHEEQNLRKGHFSPSFAHMIWTPAAPVSPSSVHRASHPPAHQNRWNNGSGWGTGGEGIPTPVSELRSVHPDFLSMVLIHNGKRLETGTQASVYSGILLSREKGGLMTYTVTWRSLRNIALMDNLK